MGFYGFFVGSMGCEFSSHPCRLGVVRVYLRSGFGVTCTRRLHIKAQRPTATLCSSYLHGVAVFLLEHTK